MPLAGRQLDFLSTNRPAPLATGALGALGHGAACERQPHPADRGPRLWLERMAAWRRTGGPWPRAILHADMDCFFVSVERLLDPSLVGKPVVVGGDPHSRGVVCSASYEARAFGIRSAMPSAQAGRLCPHAVFVPPSGPYGEYSRRVFDIFSRFTPLVQGMSLDEAYLDVTDPSGLHPDPRALAEEIRRSVQQELRLPVSLGVSTSRLCSKVASKRAKPEGVALVQPGDEAGFLGPLTLRSIPGLGEKTAGALGGHGLRTVAQLRALGPERLDILCGAGHGRALYWRLFGVDDSEVATARAAKSIGRERTFGQDVSSRPELAAALAELADRIAVDLRAEGVKAGRLTLKLRTPDFETATRCTVLDPATDDPLVLAREAVALLDRHHRGEPLRLIGASVSRLAYRGWQPDWLSAAANGETSSDGDPDSSNRDAIYQTLDAIRERHGRAALGFGSALESPLRRRPPLGGLGGAR